MKRYGTITGTVETIRYFIGTAIGILKLNYAKYTLSIVPDINLQWIDCLLGSLITSCVNWKVVLTNLLTGVDPHIIAWRYVIAAKLVLSPLPLVLWTCDSYRYRVVALYIATAAALCGNKKNHNTNGFGDGTNFTAISYLPSWQVRQVYVQLLTKLFCCIGGLTFVWVLQKTDKHTVKNRNEYAPVFCETVFLTVLVPVYSPTWDVWDIDNQQGFLAGSPKRAVWMTALVKCLMCYELFSSLVNQSGSVITYNLQTTD